MSKYMSIIGWSVAAILLIFLLHPHCGKTTTVIKPGRIDSFQVITPVKPTLVSQGADPGAVRDSAVRHIRDSLERVIKPVIVNRGSVHDTTHDTGWIDWQDTTIDTGYHFYSVIAKDSCGDSDYAEIGSASFPAKMPGDIQRHNNLHPRADTSKKYRQVDTLIITKMSASGVVKASIITAVITAIGVLFATHSR